METSDGRNGAICRLVRADGSEWRVHELRGFEEGLRVDAVRAGPHRAGPNGNGNGNGNGKAPDPSGNGGPPTRLEDELLGRGDRLQWLGEDGDVVWSMKLPMDQARSA